MPGKSRHGKGKHLHHARIIKARQPQGAAVSQPQAVAGTPQPAAPRSLRPSASAPASAAVSRVPQYPYVTRELRRIGILTGIILVILIVLARFLS